MRFEMKNGKICFSLRKFIAISPAIQKIATDCGCDAVVHSAQIATNPFARASMILAWTCDGLREPQDSKSPNKNGVAQK